MDLTKMFIMDHSSSVAAAFNDVCTVLLFYLLIPVRVLILQAQADQFLFKKQHGEGKSQCFCCTLSAEQQIQEFRLLQYFVLC